MRRCWQLYVLLAAPLVYAVIFLYWPLYGIQIAFKDFNVGQGHPGSPWAGFKYLEQFVELVPVLAGARNTLVLNFYELLALFPLPIILALLLNAVRSSRFRRGVQLITYAPHFISTVVVVGIIIMLFSPSGGIVNQVDRGRSAAQTGRLPQRGDVPAHLRLVRRLADHGLLGDHLPGRAGRHRPGAARGRPGRRRQHPDNGSGTSTCPASCRSRSPC